MNSSLKQLIIGLMLIALTFRISAQSTTFTYQGRLNDGAGPATGIYDVKFVIFDAASSGNVVGAAITNAALGVTNGLFTTALDFGNIFNGANRWLELAVRTNGVTSFATLAPRQLLTPTPYAVFAANAGTAVTAMTANNIGSVNSANIAQLNVLGTAAQATGSPVVTSGFITGANVTYGGSGYVTAPPVVVNDSTGSNAVITANISGGAVVSFTVLNAGHGYSPGATLTVGLPPSTVSQTFSGINNFSGVNTMTNPNNVFVGSFYGNGWGLTNVPVSGVAAWQVVSGTALQAQPNASYLLTNSALVTVTLPVAPSLGDVVRISGIGAGGWKLTQNAGQSIFTGNIPGVSWRRRITMPGRTAVASSADGSRLVAAVSFDRIYTSSDSGVTWTSQASSPSTNWYAIVSSADGTKLVAGAKDDAGSSAALFTSTDAGATWTSRATVQDVLGSICSSADGAKLVTISAGRICTSSDSGVTWTPQPNSPTNCVQLAASGDGTKLITGVWPPSSSNTLYTSTDSGVTWTPRSVTLTRWFSICSSTDGTKLAAVGLSELGSGMIFTSNDSGVTWVPQFSIPEASSIASSGDGTKLVVACDAGPIYVSNDSGLTWVQQFGSPSAHSVLSTVDGKKLVAANDFQVFTYASASSSGAAGYLVGSQLAVVELQYIGNGQFVLINYAGSIRTY